MLQQTAVDTWLRQFAQALENVEVILPNGDTTTIAVETIQALRKVAKYVEELEQKDRDFQQYAADVTKFMNLVQEHLNKDTESKAIKLCEDVLDHCTKSAEQQSSLWTKFKKDIGK